MQDGYGACLLKKPELIREMVAQTKSRVGELPVSIKIRIDKDSRYVGSLWHSNFLLDEA